MSGDQNQDLLIEIGCEELPPMALDGLARAFADALGRGLSEAEVDFESDAIEVFCTPRRFAARLAAVAASQPDQVLERRGPAVDAAFDTDGKPTPAALGFARSVGREVDQLETLETEKGRWLRCQVDKSGLPLSDLLYPIIEKALAQLPVKRPMRWGAHDFSFVRPMHWLVVLHGADLIPGTLLGQQAGRTTLGHRVHAPGPHELASASAYEETLEAAFVLADPVTRAGRIAQQVEALATELGCHARYPEALLREVSNLVEWPVSLACSFDETFLAVPTEALVASMQDHQKFFPIYASEADSAQLTPHFIAVANIESSDAAQVREGFERVIRPRLADARFFWEKDLEQALDVLVPGLDRVVFQDKLGSIGNKTRRVIENSKKIAKLLELPTEHTERAALLSRADLLTLMVNEFPELQGTMGRYYASAADESETVSVAIESYYAPKFSGDAIPTDEVGRVLSLADRLDTIVGIFGAGQKPSGNKDPFALRRAATGLCRILIEASVPLELDRLIAIAANALSSEIDVPPETLSEVRQFILERARTLYRDAGIPTKLVNAALAAPLSSLPDLDARVHALNAFLSTAAGASLAATNKRVGNILRKAEFGDSTVIDEDRMDSEEEAALFAAITDSCADLKEARNGRDYATILARLADLKDPADAFFDHVMVMDEDLSVRNNRLALLRLLKGQFDDVADLAQVG